MVPLLRQIYLRQVLRLAVQPVQLDAPKPGGGSSTHLNPSIPAAPSSISLTWQSTWPSGYYPSGDVYFYVTSVKGSTEGPPSDEVKNLGGWASVNLKLRSTYLFYNVSKFLRNMMQCN